MSELLSQLQQLGDGEIDDLSIAHDASEEIVALRLRVAELVEALEKGFPLLSDEGLDEVEHHCEWVIQRELKRVHSILAAHRKQEPGHD